MVESSLVDSKSDARRLIKQRGVRLDGEVIEDVKSEIEISSPKVLKVGKRRFLQLIPK
jgi:tyrosyl-tRNA synthetase